MFIVSKRNFKVRIGGEPYRIAKDYIGEIPDAVAEHPLIKGAIKSGWIAVPESHRDAELYRADAEAAQKAAEGDLRPDAHKAEGNTAEAGKTAKKAAEKPKTRRKK